MKKVTALALMFIMCLSLYACGEKQEQITAMNNISESAKLDGKYTIDDLIGVWHSEDLQQVLFVNPDVTSRYNFAANSSSMNDNDYQMEIDGDMVSYSRLGKFQIARANDVLILSCIETGVVVKGTEFLKVENIVSKEDLNGDWYCSSTGNAMKITDGEIHLNNKQKSIYRQWEIAGDTLYIRSFGMFKIVVEDDNIKLIDGAEEFVWMSADEMLTSDLSTDKRIDFSEPILLFEDESVRLEAVAFYQESQKDWDGPATHKEYITIRFHNKADYEIMCFPDQFYIGNEKVKWGYVEGTPDILSGKVANYSFRVKNSNDDSLDSIEELYQLNGRFEVFRYENNRLSNRSYIPFSMSEAYQQ